MSRMMPNRWATGWTERAARAAAIRPADGATMSVLNETLTLPRSADTVQRMGALRKRREELLKSLQGTTLNFKTFVPLYIEHQLAAGMPAYYAHGYLHEQERGRQDLRTLDQENRDVIPGVPAEVTTGSDAAANQSGAD